MKTDFHSSAQERRAMILTLLDKENEVYFCFFGEVYKANIEKIQYIIPKTL